LQTKKILNSTGRSPDGRSPFSPFFMTPIAFDFILVSLSALSVGRGSQERCKGVKKPIGARRHADSYHL
jgi:hypothetical protein